ncbi:MAG: hypothetical protein KDC53_13830 [Saprospiraceae bacterium]|nr:hypothetical protein [Saprospiraceae bacterium]
MNYKAIQLFSQYMLPGGGGKIFSYIVLFLLAVMVFSCSFDAKKKAKGNGGTEILSGQTQEIPRLSGAVVCTYLAASGEMWFGTANDGIYRYNGHAFKKYTVNDGLCSNRVLAITSDEEQNIWLGTASGLCKFDGKKFTLVPIPWSGESTDWLKDKYPVVNPAEVMSVLIERSGIFWLGTNGAGVFRYDGRAFTNFLSDAGQKMPDSLHHNIVPAISKDLQGNIWFTSMSHAGAIRYDGKSFSQFLPADGLSDDMLRTCFVDKSGNIWFGCNGNRKSGLSYFDGNTFHTYPEEDGLCNKNIRSIYEDMQGNLWLGSGRGNLCLFDGHTFHEFKDQASRTFPGVLLIAGDSEGNTWFGGKYGLWKFDGNNTEQMLEAGQSNY